jgi:hypothetical protein
MQTEIICPVWFDHFLKSVKPIEDDPVMLMLDGHATHTKNIALLEKARENHVHILCIPPHISHRLQPLDVSFVLSLSTYYAQQSETWLRQNPDKVVTVRQVGYLFGKAYRRATTPRNAENGFPNNGICPFDLNFFAEEEFAAADTTDRPQISNCDEAGTNGPMTGSHGSVQDIFHPNCGSHELFLPKSKRFKSDQTEQASPSNTIKEIPVETQNGSDLPHVSPSDIMSIPKADAALKRSEQTRGSITILT